MAVRLTQELKERFFAQYYGQNVFKYNGTPIPFMTPDYVLLRPVDQITDEEAIEVAKIVWPTHEYLHTSDEGRWYLLEERLTRPYDYSLLIDYLRSIGVAVTYLGISVEDLVSAGWIKLTNPPA